MDEIKVGIIGFGNMGRSHARRLSCDDVKHSELHAICDNDPNALKNAKKLYPDVLLFDNAEDLIKSGKVDAITIATPHYDHPPLAIMGFENGLHVLVEKPAGVYTKQVRKMNEAALKASEKGLVFTMMFNQRTNPVYAKAKDLYESGELGKLRRVNWIITSWFRTQSYYNSGGWRATWSGEGGGVLANQCPHQLDLIQWICGMPSKVRGFCFEGKYHDIEVEDDVTAYFEYENGATGVFIATTGDYPGTNRLEITGTKGKIIIENEKITFTRLRKDINDVIYNDPSGFAKPEIWDCKIQIRDKNTAHTGILNNWISAIVNGTELLAPGTEGINGVELENAIYLSSWLDKTVKLPVDEDLFFEKLQDKIKNSKYKKVVHKKQEDLEGTYK